MAFTTVTVSLSGIFQNVTPFDGTARFKLVRPTLVSNTLIVPLTWQEVTFTTQSGEGGASISLIPNILISTSSYYAVEILKSDGTCVFYGTCVVPNRNCNFSEILNLPATDETPMTAQAYASQAKESAYEANQSAEEAEEAVATHNTSTTAHQDIRALIVSSGLPEQTGHAGEYLTTDGTDPSWSEVNALPTQSSETSGKFLKSGDGTTEASWDTVDVSGAISTHNSDTTAHSDIRTAVASILPSQTGHSGKVLGTDGSATSWVPVSTMATVTDTTSTMIALPTAAANTNYTYGQLSSFAVGFSSSSTANDEIHIMFKSGTTATTLSVEGTNALFSSFTPNASSVVEIDARYYSHLSKWIVLFSQVAIS